LSLVDLHWLPPIAYMRTHTPLHIDICTGMHICIYICMYVSMYLYVERIFGWNWRKRQRLRTFATDYSLALDAYFSTADKPDTVLPKSAPKHTQTIL